MASVLSWRVMVHVVSMSALACAYLEAAFTAVRPVS